MAEHLSDEEQLEALKRWWRDNGLGLLLAVVLGIGGWFGWDYWQQREQRIAAQSSLLYTAMIEAFSRWQSVPDSDSAAAVTAQADALRKLDEDRQYARFGALLVARMAAAEGDYDNAAAELAWVVDTAEDEATRALATLRLARVEAARGDGERALSLLVESETTQGYNALYAELRGDILARQGESVRARAAYSSALEQLGSEDVSSRALLELKINELTPADTGEGQG